MNIHTGLVWNSYDFVTNYLIKKARNYQIDIQFVQQPDRLPVIHIMFAVARNSVTLTMLIDGYEVTGSAKDSA